MAIKEFDDSISKPKTHSLDLSDDIEEGDDYFSIRGELIYTRAETEQLIIKIKQKKRQVGKRLLPFKLSVKGKVPIEFLRHFVDLEVRRNGHQLCLENFEIIERIPTRAGKKREGRENKGRN